MKTCLFDVDGVIVDTVTPFLEQGSDMNYWLNPKLYDNLDPHPDTYKAMDMLKHAGYHVVICSTTFCEHVYSKHKFLRLHFPHVDSVFMRNKHLYPCDLVIDDREIVMDGFKTAQPGAKLILTSYGRVLSDVKKFLEDSNVCT